MTPIISKQLVHWQANFVEVMIAGNNSVLWILGPNPTETGSDGPNEPQEFRIPAKDGIPGRLKQQPGQQRKTVSSEGCQQNGSGGIRCPK